MSEDETLNMIVGQLSIERSNIRFIEKGSEGFVYFFLDNDGNKKIIKVYSNTISIEKSFDEIKEKSKTTEKLIQDSIKTLKILEDGALIDEKGNKIFYQISDFMEYSLFNLVLENKINSYEAYLIALKIVIGVCSLHKIGIAHRDLKLENTMVDLSKKKVKIIDFGFSDKIEKNKEYISNGTKEYAAPEVFNGDVNSRNILATDIYSLGILLFTLMTGKGSLVNIMKDSRNRSSFNKCLINRLRYLDYFKNNTEKKILPYETQEIKFEFLDLLKQMISIDSNDRPEANEVLEIMTEIFLEIEEEAKNQQENDYIELKPREKIMIEMFTGIDFFDIDSKELENIAEKNAKKIKDILENNEITNNLKNCIKQSINEILNNNIFKFEDEGEPEELSMSESLKLAKVRNHLEEMVFIKNNYYFNEIKNKKQNKFVQNLEDIMNLINYNNNEEEQNSLFSKKV